MLNLILLLAVVGTVLGQDCLYDGETKNDGDTFPSTDGCNTCFCTNGNVGCTYRVCVKQCEYNGKKYFEGEEFPHIDGCNKCFCKENGRYGCTMKSCSLNSIKRAINPTGCYYNNQHHDVGDTYEAIDGCNMCSCGMTGQSLCTLMACHGCNYNGHWYNVDDQFVAEDGCNTCVCTETGAAACSLRMCPPKGCEYSGGFYNVGDHFNANDGCNTCRCTESGAVACTRKSCRYQKRDVTCEYKGQKYEANEDFYDDCNNCRCLSNGHVRCSKKTC